MVSVLSPPTGDSWLKWQKKHYCNSLNLTSSLGFSRFSILQRLGDFSATANLSTEKPRLRTRKVSICSKIFAKASEKINCSQLRVLVYFRIQHFPAVFVYQYRSYNTVYLRVLPLFLPGILDMWPCGQDHFYLPIFPGSFCNTCVGILTLLVHHTLLNKLRTQGFLPVSAPTWNTPFTSVLCWKKKYWHPL